MNDDDDDDDGLRQDIERLGKSQSISSTCKHDPKSIIAAAPIRGIIQSPSVRVAGRSAVSVLGVRRHVRPDRVAASPLLPRPRVTSLQQAESPVGDRQASVPQKYMGAESFSECAAQSQRCLAQHVQLHNGGGGGE